MIVKPTHDGGRMVAGDTPWLAYRVVDGHVEQWEPRDLSATDSPRTAGYYTAARRIDVAIAARRMAIYGHTGGDIRAR